MNLPSPIQAYFDADRHDDAAALIRVFAPEAAVHDEGRTYVGGRAIEAWWREAKAKYRPLIEPLEMGEDGNAIKVRARVTGRFPGSPAMISFAFQLAGGQISDLDIGA